MVTASGGFADFAIDVSPTRSASPGDRVVLRELSATSSVISLADQDSWAELRLCLSCGWVGCSDDSPNQHAKRHYQETDHPIVASCEPGSTWRWCYVHQRAV